MLRTWVTICLSLGVVSVPLHAAQANPAVQVMQPETVHVTTFSGDWAITFTGHKISVVNKGQVVNDVTVELYRPVANQQDHSMAMIAGTGTTHLMPHGAKVTLGNDAVLHNVDKVEFVITWKLDGRKYKQSLYFTHEELQKG
jgi:hypothetical protein